MRTIRFIGSGAAAAALISVGSAAQAPDATPAPHPAPYQANITRQTEENTAFRRVLFTGTKTQLVAMSIPPGGEIGLERHAHVEQLLFCESGQGEVILDGVKAPFVPGDVVVLTPGASHNFVNTGQEPLKIYTVYAPPNHLDGRVQATKAAADADTDDEAFGRGVK